MPSKTLLVEIGSEELPPKSLNRLRQSLGASIEKELGEAQLTFDAVSSYATPRRLAVSISRLADRQPDQNIEKRGPAKKAAFDENGEPTKALLGFMRGCGVEESDQLETIETDKGEYLVYRDTQPGQSIEELLPAILSKSLSELPIDRRMRWGSSREEFVRPVSWVVCLYGGRVLPVTVMGLSAGNLTFGHRFMSQGEITLESADEYIETLRAHKVLVDFDGRREVIRKQVEELAAEEGGQLEMDDALLDEVTALVEWPVPLAGQFEKDFLRVPPEVLISAMKEHQRYFHLVDDEGNLAPKFITVSNIESRDPAVVIDGNEKVIRPRLSDAAFFFDQDTKTSLDDKTGRLKQVVFQSELGSYHDKATRISSLAGYIAGELGLNEEAARKAGMLCKADLVSDMVGEFPDLQGTMGGHYASHDGLADEVVKGIAQHYRPVQSGSELPDEGIASCVALADKIDSLVGLFGINQPPTGSRDPFGLRRQSLGVIRICVENHLDLSLSNCLSQAAGAFETTFDTGEVTRYIIERLAGYYADQGITGDVVDAATGSGSQDINLLEIDDVIKTLEVFKSSPQAGQIVSSNKRVANILRKADMKNLPAKFDDSLATDDAEKDLYAAMQDVDLANLKGAGARLEKLAVLQGPIDRFFDDVLVMAEDPALRDNRLCLLSHLRKLFLEVADFSLLQ